MEVYNIFHICFISSNVELEELLAIFLKYELSISVTSISAAS